MIKLNYGKLTSMLMMPEEADYVTNAIEQMPSDGLMVEWGSGGSTCLWLDKMNAQQKLITIEHHKEWFDLVSDSVVSHFTSSIFNRFKFFYAPEAIGYLHGYGSIDEENPFGVSKYVSPSPEIFDADVFFIDGIARGACLASVLLNRTNKDSRVLLHDFTPRIEAYGWISQFCDVKNVGSTLAELTYVGPR